jgi:acetyl/propionyl-CoA carboxylase alpha subunit
MRRWLIRNEQSILTRIVTDSHIYEGEDYSKEIRIPYTVAGRDVSPSGGEHCSGSLDVQLDGKMLRADYALSATHADVVINGFYYRLQRERFQGKGASHLVAKELKAEIPGKIIKIMVEVGTICEAGTPVVIQEAMKMEMVLKAPAHVVIEEIFVTEGVQVEADAILIRFGKVNEQ